MSFILIVKLSNLSDDRAKWKSLTDKAKKAVPELISTPAARKVIDPKISRIVVGQYQEPGSNSWVYASLGYVIETDQQKIKYVIRLEREEIARGSIQI